MVYFVKRENMNSAEFFETVEEAQTRATELVTKYGNSVSIYEATLFGTTSIVIEMA